jgi:hypothetical protein
VSVTMANRRLMCHLPLLLARDPAREWHEPVGCARLASELFLARG